MIICLAMLPLAPLDREGGQRLVEAKDIPGQFARFDALALFGFLVLNPFSCRDYSLPLGLWNDSDAVVIPHHNTPGIDNQPATGDGDVNRAGAVLERAVWHSPARKH